MKTKLGRKGFTLVEIMIVVAIIGLLAAIAIPNLLRARINANDSAVQGDLRAFSTASESYRAALQPATYGTAGLMTSAVPAYLDATWAAATAAVGGGVIKHGHFVSQQLGAAVGGVISTYTVNAVVRANESVNAYCIDQTGVLRVQIGAPVGAAATGGAGGQAAAPGTNCGGIAVV